MGRDFIQLNPADGALPAFAVEFRAFKDASGGPTLRTVAEGTGLGINIVQAAFAGKKKPKWVTVSCIVAYLGGDEAYWKQRYSEMEAALAAVGGGRGKAPLSLDIFRRTKKIAPVVAATDEQFALETITTASEYVDALSKLKAASGLTLRKLEEFSGVPYASLFYLFKRHTLPRWAQVEQVLAGFARSGLALAEDVDAWKEARDRVAMIEMLKRRHPDYRPPTGGGPGRERRTS